MTIPFIRLLLPFAVMPFLNKHWWEHHYLGGGDWPGARVIGYYVVGLDAPGGGWSSPGWNTSVSYALIRFTVVGCGRQPSQDQGKSPAHEPSRSCQSARSSRTIRGNNRRLGDPHPSFIRVKPVPHPPFHIVFFIFIVSNMGGALTPSEILRCFWDTLRGVPIFSGCGEPLVQGWESG